MTGIGHMDGGGGPGWLLGTDDRGSALADRVGPTPPVVGFDPIGAIRRLIGGGRSEDAATTTETARAGDDATGVQRRRRRESATGDLSFQDVRSTVDAHPLVAALQPPDVRSEVAGLLRQLPPHLREAVLPADAASGAQAGDPADTLAARLLTVLASQDPPLGIDVTAIQPAEGNPQGATGAFGELGGLQQIRILAPILADGALLADPQAVADRIQAELPAAWADMAAARTATLIETAPQSDRGLWQTLLDQLPAGLRQQSLTVQPAGEPPGGPGLASRFVAHLSDQVFAEADGPSAAFRATMAELPLLAQLRILVAALEVPLGDERQAAIAGQLAQEVMASEVYQQLPSELREAIDGLDPAVKQRVLTSGLVLASPTRLDAGLRAALADEIGRLSTALPRGLQQNLARHLHIGTGPDALRHTNATEMARMLQGLAVPAPGAAPEAVGGPSSLRSLIGQRLMSNDTQWHNIHRIVGYVGQAASATITQLLGSGLVSLSELQAIVGPDSVMGRPGPEQTQALARRVTAGLGILIMQRTGLGPESFQPPLFQATGQPADALSALSERLRSGAPLAELIEEALPLATGLIGSDTEPPPRFDAPADSDGIWRPKHLAAIASLMLDAQRNGSDGLFAGIRFRVGTVPPENPRLDPLTDFISRARPAYFVHDEGPHSTGEPPTMVLVDGAESLPPSPRLRETVVSWNEALSRGRVATDPNTPEGRFALTLQGLLAAQVSSDIRMNQRPVQGGLHAHLQQTAAGQGPRALEARRLLDSGLRPDQMATIWALSLRLEAANPATNNGQSVIRDLRDYLGSLDPTGHEASRIQDFLGDRIAALNDRLIAAGVTDPRAERFTRIEGRPVPTLSGGPAIAPAEGLLVIGGGRMPLIGAMRPPQTDPATGRIEYDNVSALLRRTIGQGGDATTRSFLELNRHDPRVRVEVPQGVAGALGISGRVSADAFLQALSAYSARHRGAQPPGFHISQVPIVIPAGHQVLVPPRTASYSSDAAQQQQFDHLDARSSLLWRAGRSIDRDLAALARSRDVATSVARQAQEAREKLAGPMPPPPIPLDGIYGPRTMAAIRSLQQDSGMGGAMRDGLFSIRTLDRWVERLRAGIGQTTHGEAAISRYVNHEGGHVMMESLFAAFGQKHLGGLGALDEAQQAEQLMFLWSNLSGWRLANGNLPGMDAPDAFTNDTASAIASLSGQSLAGNLYSFDSEAGFVSDYARSSPEEDFAESMRFFRQRPEQLLHDAPEKFLFLNALLPRHSAEGIVAMAERVFGSAGAARSRLTEALERLTSPPAHHQLLPLTSRQFAQSPAIAELMQALQVEVPLPNVDVTTLGVHYLAGSVRGIVDGLAVAVDGLGEGDAQDNQHPGPAGGAPAAPPPSAVDSVHPTALIERAVRMASAHVLGGSTGGGQYATTDVQATWVSLASQFGPDQTVSAVLTSSVPVAGDWLSRARRLPMPETGNPSDPRNAAVVSEIRRALIDLLGESARAVVEAMTPQCLLELRVGAADGLAIAALRTACEGGDADRQAAAQALAQGQLPAGFPAGLLEQVSPGMRSWLTSAAVTGALASPTAESARPLVQLLQARPQDILQDFTRPALADRTVRDAFVQQTREALRSLVSDDFGVVATSFPVDSYAATIRQHMAADPGLRVRYGVLFDEMERRLIEEQVPQDDVRLTKLRDLRGLVE